jgi:type VI secretion system secreted protein Hcp
MVSAFLKIAGIPGGSSDPKHKSWIEVLSYEWGGAFSNSKPKSSDFTVTKEMDLSTPHLYRAACDGKEFPEITFEVTRSGKGNAGVIIRYQFRKVFVHSYDVEPQGAEGSRPVEKVSFLFDAVDWPRASAGGASPRAVDKASRR